MPPRWIEPVWIGLNGSETSYWRISPVPQHETYRKRSSRERLRSVTNGGTVPKPLSRGGRRSGSAGSAGMSMTFLMSHLPFSWYQSQIEAERSFKETTTPAKQIGRASCRERV